MASNFFKNKRKPEPKFVPQPSMMKEEIGFLNAFKANEEKYYNDFYIITMNPTYFTGTYHWYTTTAYNTIVTLAE